MQAFTRSILDSLEDMHPSRSPGRLGDPTMNLLTDPRTTFKLAQAGAALGLGKTMPPTPITRKSPIPEIMAYARAREEQMEKLLGLTDYTKPIPGDKTASVKLTRTEEFVEASDGHKIKLIIQRPADFTGPLPAVLNFHGGGMCLLHTEIPLFETYSASIARTGIVAIMVDFRNAVGPDGKHFPFPTGLNDCADAIRWVHANRTRLDISRIVLEGESGGANLSIAASIRAKREGWLDAIDGVYAVSPYISGAYHMSDEWKKDNLPSLIECDNYFVEAKFSGLTSKIYDPTEENAKNPLAWPYWATEEDLKGLPPHFVHIAELDLMRDEDRNFVRKLEQAGVRVVAKVTPGMSHIGEKLFRHIVPEYYLQVIWSIKTFADSL